MPASDEQRAATAERRARLMQMKLAGATWDEIAKRLGYSGKAAACKDFQRALESTRSTIAHNAAELREIELLRIDRIAAGSWPDAMRGDHRAAKVVLECSDRRVRLLDLTGAQKSFDNAVDAWVDHLRGGGLDDDDQAALDAVAAAAA